MKKIIFILAIIAYSATAQTYYNISSIAINNTLPATINPGDTLTLYLGVNGYIQGSKPAGDTLRISLSETPGGSPNGQLVEIFKIQYDDLNNMPTVVYNSAGSVLIKIKIPDFGYYNQCQLIITDEPTRPSIIINSPNVTVTAIVSPMDTSMPGTVWYYNINGILIKECRLGEPINLIGHYIYRILYDDKSMKSGQIYFSN